MVSAETHPNVYAKLKEDFYDILKRYKRGAVGTITGKNKMLQIRTAGSGNKEKRNYAFYLTKSCTNDLLKRGGSRHSLLTVASRSRVASAAASTASAAISAATSAVMSSSKSASSKGKTAKGTKKRKRKRRLKGK